ncbi:MAG: hypothetical protein IT576_22010 [Verrucomicrobiales bacterium]|nr:hypothetical protein [Verrucomicrobiales bacterium]
MKAKSILALVAIIGSASSLLVTGCVSKNSSGGGTAQPGYYGGSNTYSPMPMNQAARTEAMRQQYRKEFR